MISEKYKIFIGSSSEALPIANKIKISIDHILKSKPDLKLEVVIWNARYKENDTSNKTFMQTFDKILDEFNFSLFIINKDDQINKRVKKSRELKFSARDNVWLEAGMFMGRNGLDKTFFFLNMSEFDDLHFPTDINGYTLDGVNWDSNLADIYFNSSTATQKLFSTCPTALTAIELKINTEVENYCKKLVQNIEIEIKKPIVTEKAIIINDPAKCFDIGKIIVEKSKTRLYTTVSFGKSFNPSPTPEEQAMETALIKKINDKKVSFKRYMKKSVSGINTQFNTLQNIINSFVPTVSHINIYDFNFDYLELIVADNDILMVFPDYRGTNTDLHEKVAFGFLIEDNSGLADVLSEWLMKKLK